MTTTKAAEAAREKNEETRKQKAIVETRKARRIKERRKMSECGQKSAMTMMAMMKMTETRPSRRASMNHATHKEESLPPDRRTNCRKKR